MSGIWIFDAALFMAQRDLYWGEEIALKSYVDRKQSCRVRSPRDFYFAQISFNKNRLQQKSCGERFTGWKEDWILLQKMVGREESLIKMEISVRWEINLLLLAPPSSSLLSLLILERTWWGIQNCEGEILAEKSAFLIPSISNTKKFYIRSF